MIDFSIPKVSKAEVARAGKILGGLIPHDDAAVEDYAKVFRIAYDWRNSHQYPMQRMRHELTGKVRKFQLEGVTAGRTKRMSSIRKKLLRSPITLGQIQDFGVDPVRWTVCGLGRFCFLGHLGFVGDR
jgi:hypothetical protein